MRRLLLVLLLPLAACSSGERNAMRSREDLAVLDVKQQKASNFAPPPFAPPPPEKLAPPPATKVDVPLPGPQIAYSYTYGYRLGSGAIAAAQAAHIALCDKLGPARCRVAKMLRASSDGQFSTATLNLLVDGRIARAFGADLDKAVAGVGGENSDRGIEAEDLSKAMIDTQARVTAKQALADRLMTIIKTRSGSVADLVEAERAFADAQEELDSARTSMAEMQGRVALSSIDITYSSRDATNGGLWRPVRDAFDSAGQTLGNSIGALLTFLVVALPWVLLLAGLLWLKRRLGWRTGVRWPWRRGRYAVSPIEQVGI